MNKREMRRMMAKALRRAKRKVTEALGGTWMASLSHERMVASEGSKTVSVDIVTHNGRKPDESWWDALDEHHMALRQP